VPVKRKLYHRDIESLLKWRSKKLSDNPWDYPFAWYVASYYTIGEVYRIDGRGGLWRLTHHTPRPFGSSIVAIEMTRVGRGYDPYARFTFAPVPPERFRELFERLAKSWEKYERTFHTADVWGRTSQSCSSVSIPF